MVNYGFILGEVVRRVTGKPLQDCLREWFLDPLGLHDTFMGLPRAEFRRAAGVYPGALEQVGVTLVFRSRWVRGASLPAATLNASARDLAVFYQMLLNGGVYNHQRCLEEKTITQATALQVEDFDHTIGLPTRWALGFHIGGQIQPDLPPLLGTGSSLRTFGHYGQSSSMSWADPDEGLVVAFTCSRLLQRDDSRSRWAELNNAVWEMVGKA
jgi:CubicO group peptidase (beta-lactamase class C family)